LTINFGSSFPDITTSVGDYQVFVRGPDGYERQLHIVSWDDATKRMKVKFNGAPSSDQYEV
jgi:DNA/RNA-binding domain of Phe-tRNA-synthetase-like protein